MTREDRKTFLYNYVIPGCLFLAPWLSPYCNILFALMCLHVVFELSYQGFMRMSRFGVSQNHPVLNRILNIIILILPFAAFLFRGGAVVFIPLLLILHIVSEIRSPDEAKIYTSRLQMPVWKYASWLAFYCIGLVAIIMRG